MRQQLNIDRIYPKKSLGQNFIHDKNFLEKLSNKLLINNETNIIEIGPGKGALTEYLIQKTNKNIFLIEKDNNLFTILKKKYLNLKNIHIINEDALKLDYELAFKNQNVIIVGNLPFNISTQLLMRWIETSWPPFYDKMYLMFQKEVAERIISKHNSKKYGKLSVIAQTRFSIRKILTAPSSIFIPEPKVGGIVLEFRPKSDYKGVNLKKLQFILTKSFSQRRKKIKTSLREYIEILKANNIDENQRAENLSIDEYNKISKFV